MKKVLFLAVCFAGLAMSSCGKKTLAQEMAEKVCNCPATQEMVKIRKEMDGKSDAEKEALRGKRMEAEKQMDACMGDTESKVKALKPEEMAKFPEDFKAAVTKQCPDIAKAMDNK